MFNKMRFHVLTPPHNICNLDYTACAYQMKAYKFCKMMTERGHEVILYGVEGMDTQATEQVTTVSREVYDRVYGQHDYHSKFFKYDINDEVYQTYFKNTIEEIEKRKQKNDFILPFWGVGNRPICDAHPDLITVEPGIGYAGGHWARWKVFESYAIFHAYKGLTAVGSCNMDNYDVVINNYFDPDDFYYQPKKADYLLFIGRIYGGKGLHIAIQVAKATGHRLVIAGQGSLAEAGYAELPDHCDYIGYADRETRKTIMAGARAIIVASQYLEPFGGTQVESLFSGTPIITSDWGAMAELNQHGVTGYRCRTFEQYCWAVRNIDRIDPAVCRSYALNNFSLEAIAPKYEEYFQSVLDVYTGQGWYQEHGIDQIHLAQRYIPATNDKIDYDLIDSEEQPQAQSLAEWLKINNYSQILDIGCGPGTYINEYIGHGLLAQGIEPDSRSQHPNIRPGTLLEPIEDFNDCVVCLEVLEHIDPQSADLALDNLVNAVANTLIFSAARPGQGGTGHINSRPKSYWEDKLTARGLRRNTDLEQDLLEHISKRPHMGWFKNNVMVFTH